MWKHLAAAGLVALCLAPAPTGADDAIVVPPSALPGADDPAFREALTAWLAGDDGGSLPALVVLANADNLAVQLLLGTIDDRSMGLTPWLQSLSREEYSAVFRRMDGRFGTGWLKVAAEAGSELAELLRFPDVGAGFSADHALALAARGEPRATARHLSVLLNQGHWAEAARLEPVAAGYGMQAMAWAAATRVYGDDPAIAMQHAAGQAALAAGTMDGYVLVRLADREAPWLAAVPEETHAFAREVTVGRSLADDAGPLSAEAAAFLDDWLATAAEAELPRRWCAAACPGAEAACRGDLYALIGGLWALPFMESSPLETLIPQEVWVTTPRALMVMEFHALGMARASTEPLETLDELPVEACVKDGLAQALVMPDQ